ncbi:hypothetical protein DY000_02064033 [Brassica cretica]|uniref:Uncharacterized protein n=1 Tax=Brassica cretica TaxID=69181 RepID=A0ABQ7B025_BRACR|nr:hypothetical protein DY000_02064033 [Brassica cretica]
MASSLVSGHRVKEGVPGFCRLGVKSGAAGFGHPRWLDKFFVNERSISGQIE